MFYASKITVFADNAPQVRLAKASPSAPAIKKREDISRINAWFERTAKPSNAINDMLNVNIISMKESGGPFQDEVRKVKLRKRTFNMKTNSCLNHRRVKRNPKSSRVVACISEGINIGALKPGTIMYP